MRVFSEKRIWISKEKWPNAATALDQWYRVVKRNSPCDFAAMKSLFSATDKVGEFHVFDIGGNKLRLIAFVSYRSQKLYIKYVLDHREYERGKWKEGRE
ncbi:type II toxin-antitoxin system HigB family toxin [Pseudomonas azerbaijanoccidens]|jgi:mRNA interferase HigB|uniref:mRNA interferase toxin HigB n=1 Tax=Pseudomonas fluorescens TaxID=294 RepID=A0A5E7DW12_PSEFL|nr:MULTISPECIES: type II toxin-antitoxin system HigB family toxin [Pseudomonas]MCK8665008.1 type II toxin-antitoxin system HigB family toxin [Pseudomonas azerbaijanoccidentalis]VVO11492.1 mRNA interferase toxin HigB [Pseudomonas fluorescens]